MRCYRGCRPIGRPGQASLQDDRAGQDQKLAVEIVNGVNQDRYPVAGWTVSQVRLALRDVFNIDAGAEALIDGRPVPGETILAPGQTLEFIRAGGHKGVGEHVWTEEQFLQFFQVTHEDLGAWIAQGLRVKRCLDGSVRITETAVDNFIEGKAVADLNQDGQPFGSDLLTDDEAIRYLRLDTIQIANPQETLRRYREQGLLRGTQVSKKVFYRRCELDRFLARITEENPR